MSIQIYGGCSHFFFQVTLNNLINTPSNSPVISEKGTLQSKLDTMSQVSLTIDTYIRTIVSLV